ncbi:unnamed protein product [Paramecium sonneborni]|uniref:Uncharacterized protein n=1 Tax=Paramecium sonneborni TaxID=65129 RepID=A0A8S1R1L8_9CILI|nr:unnamed protein product [Paramecium sonneborni]
MTEEDICLNIQQGECKKNDGNLREIFNVLSTFNNPYILYNEKYLKLKKLLDEQDSDQGMQNILGQDLFNNENDYYQEFQNLEQMIKSNNMIEVEKDVIQRKIAQQLVNEYQAQLKLNENQLFGLIYSHKNNEKFGNFLIMKNQQIESLEQVQAEREVTTLFKDNELTKLCAILGYAEFFNDEREKQVSALSLNGSLYLLKFDNQRELISCLDYVNGQASSIRIQDIAVKNSEGVRYFLIKQ